MIFFWIQSIIYLRKNVVSFQINLILIQQRKNFGLSFQIFCMERGLIQTKNPTNVCEEVCLFVPQVLKGQKDTILDVSA